MPSRSPLYGQVVVGPPGSGKTTFCNGMQQYLKLLGRDCGVINLDPANEGELPYDTIIDVVQDIVSLSTVMKDLELGPNGGLLYCMEYLEAHTDELIDMIREKVSEKTYILIDLPGQSEVFTHGSSVHFILKRLEKVLDLRLCCVQLVDSTFCTDATKFLSATMLGTTSMIRLELPTVNVLSKIDLLQGELAFQLDFFLECQDLERLVEFVDSGVPSEQDYEINDDEDYQAARRQTRNSTFWKKHMKLYRVLAEVVDDYGLLHFMPLDINKADSVGSVLAKIDRANGYVFIGGTVQEDLFQCAVAQSEGSTFETIADIQERLDSQIKEESDTTEAK